MEDLETALEQYHGSFPCVVHVFEINQRSAYYKLLETSLNAHTDIDVSALKQLHRIHSFVVLGQDEEYICFQKKGPNIDQPFEIITLPQACVSLHTSEARERIVFFGPVPRE